MQLDTERAYEAGGFVAAEGCFVRSSYRDRPSFAFVVAVGAADERACTWLASFFGCGTIHHYARRRAHYDDEVRFQVRKLRDLVEVVVPFMDEHLPPSYKREQYHVWREELLRYWEHDARRRRPCVVEACDRPAVAHGRCHKHDMQWRRQRQRDERPESRSSAAVTRSATIPLLVREAQAVIEARRAPRPARQLSAGPSPSPSPEVSARQSTLGTSAQSFSSA